MVITAVVRAVLIKETEGVVITNLMKIYKMLFWKDNPMTHRKEIPIISMAKYHNVLFPNQSTIGQKIVLTISKAGTVKCKIILCIHEVQKCYVTIFLEKHLLCWFWIVVTQK